VVLPWVRPRFFCDEKGEKMSAYQNYLAVAKAQRDLLVEVIAAHGGDLSIDELRLGL